MLVPAQRAGPPSQGLEWDQRSGISNSLQGSDAAVSGSTLGEELSPGNEAGVRDVGQGTASVSHSHYWQ